MKKSIWINPDISIPNPITSPCVIVYAVHNHHYSFSYFMCRILLQSLTILDFDFLFLYFWCLFESARLNQEPPRNPLAVPATQRKVSRGYRVENRTLDLPCRTVTLPHSIFKLILSISQPLLLNPVSAPPFQLEGI
jgi:hypothetical protein